MKKWAKELGRDIGASRHYLLAALLIFGLGIYFGYRATGNLAAYLEVQVKAMSELSRKLEAFRYVQLGLFVAIFVNNFMKAILFIYVGSMFALFPIYSILLNGLLIGYLVRVQSEQHGHVLMLVAKGILPHGILEIPAMILACGYGIRFGSLVLRMVFTSVNPERRSRIRGEFKGFFQVQVPLLIMLWVLLLAAAIIESTVTYTLMGHS